MGDKTITPKDEKATEGGAGESHSFVAKYYKKYLLEVEDVHFHTNSAVLLPEQIKDADSAKPADPEDHDDTVSGLGVIAGTYQHAKENPAHKLLIAGHTDTTATISFNLELSRLRAENVHAVLKGDADGWAAICNKRHRPEDYHHILWWISTAFLWDCHPKSISQADTPSTLAAVKSFQTIYKETVDDSMKVDGIVGIQTWKAIFYMYMLRLKNLLNVDDAGLQAHRDALKFVNDKFHAVGCSEHFPIDHAELDSYRSTRNRRVEILFFESGEEPILRCHPSLQLCYPQACLIYQKKGYKTVPVIIKPTKKPGKVVNVALQLQYRDPEGNPHPFPADFPVIVEYQRGERVDPTPRTAKKGMLSFAADKSLGSFTLRFERTKGAVYFSSPPGGSGDTDGYVGDPGLQEAWLKQMRVMKMPGLHHDEAEGATWGLKESDWFGEDNSSAFDEAKFGTLNTKSDGDIGTTASPLQLILDPHWQFIRFEFFDRFFGHSDHEHKRISSPAVLLEGFRDENDWDEPPDTLSTWMFKESDLKSACQALPWILRRGSDGTELPKLTAEMLLRFKSTPDAGQGLGKVAYVKSGSATERRAVFLDLAVADDAALLLPSAERLKYYDLPLVWESKNYFTRIPGAAGKPFNDLTEDELAKSLESDNKLTFSLDDIILTDAALAKHELTDPAKEQMMIFHHSFSDASSFDSNKYSPEGIFKYGTDKKKEFFPYSDVQMLNKSYLTDYPDWTRLIIVQGNFFDVFDKRTGELEDVVGARAAVRWVNSATSGGGGIGVPPGTDRPDADRIKNDYFALQPYYKQAYDGSTIGRFDMCLLRCCDHKDAEEQGVNLQFYRFFFDYAAAPAKYQTTDPAHLDNRATLGTGAAERIIRRWNGKDERTGASAAVFNEAPAEIVLVPPSASPPPPFKAKVLWITQVTPEIPAHFKIGFVPETGTSSMGIDGTGSMRELAASDSATRGFVMAHECGHAGSLPDEYFENRDRCSYGFPPIRFNGIPGDIFDLDKGGDKPMMNFNHVIRPRYYWHAAEWIRTLTGHDYRIEHAGHKFFVPHHPTSALTASAKPPTPRTHVYAPLKGVLSAQTKGKFDAHFFALGEERFSKVRLKTGKEFNALACIVLKMNLRVPVSADWKKTPTSAVTGTHGRIVDFITKMNDRLKTRFNQGFQADGKVGGVSFDKVFIFFRFAYLVETITDEDIPENKKELDNYNSASLAKGKKKYETKYAALKSNPGFHLTVEVKDPPFATAAWDVFPNPSLLTIPEANAAANMENLIADYFGIDRTPATWPEPGALKPLLEKVMDAGPSVALA